MTGNKFLFRQTLLAVAVFLFILILATTLFRVFAWAETADTPLAISDIKAELISNGSIVISWKTNKPADATVTYSDDLSFSQQKTLSTLYLERAIILDNIKPDTLYHYRVISRTPQGEEARSLHLMVQSHLPVDITVSQIMIDPAVKLYSGQPPLLDKDTLVATLRNNGNLDWSNDFFVSFLIATDDNDVANEGRLPYSCFVEKNISAGIKAQEEKNISLEANDLAGCDPLLPGKYILTVAADYDERTDDSNRENNTATISVTNISSTGAPQFTDLTATVVTASSATMTVSLEPQQPGAKVTVEYAPQNYWDNDTTQGQYQYQQDAVIDRGEFSTQIKGLDEETTYHLRVRLVGTNVVSDDVTFMTKKNLQADSDRLLALKRLDPTCRVVDSQPLATSFWQDLGLTLPEPQPILRYRIQWSNGGWSPWYIPGNGDIDWQQNTAGQDRRIWSYFQGRAFQYETCGSGTLPSTDKASKAVVQEKYGSTIDTSLEAKNEVVKSKIIAFDRALKYYKRGVSTDNWQTLRDAYIYGGYSLAEITDSIVYGPGPVHPTIPAQIWRQQYQVQLSSNNY
ncbi:MAG: hypothetical protein V1846_05360 [Candidatus Komeilibacteria bacterium]